MHYIILPYQGVQIQDGPRLDFGQSIDQVQSIWGEPRFIRNYDNGNQRHTYQEFAVDYDADGVEAIEFFERHDGQVFLHSTPLFHRSYQEVSDYLKGLGGQQRDKGEFVNIGLNIWQQYGEDDAEISTILAFKRGYFKETLEEEEARRAEKRKKTRKPPMTDVELLESVEQMLDEQERLMES